MASVLDLRHRRQKILKVAFALSCIVAVAGAFPRLMWPQTAGSQPGAGLDSLSLNTGAVYPRRFLAVHGRRALIDGYSENGLEVWAYPLQLIRSYRLGFRVEGETSEIPGQAILRRITYRPEAVIRTYIGPDFIVRENIFVPLDKAGVVIVYTVEGKKTLDIVVHFVPVLNLMWPAAIGGQDVSWNTAANSYVISEPTNRFAAVIGSKDIVAHDEIFNSADNSSHVSLAFTVHAGGDFPRAATVVIASMENVHGDSALIVKDLSDSRHMLEQAAADHYAGLLANQLQIETPDTAINQDLAWSMIALDQAWVCNPYLGCGLVAGYGPSRAARRPQYAWFFAGDGMIAARALVSAGGYSRAQDELRFIAKYQDKKTGMVWHEIPQSAGFLDWAGKYPYMFVHVDITFQYLNAMASYVSASGDRKFLQEQWPTVESAYRYCQSLLDPHDGLPRIPANKEGGDEQDRMSDELTLSASWVKASASFARMAAWMNDSATAKKAEDANTKARASFAQRYWNAQDHFWIDGYTPAGKPIFNRSSSGNVAIAEHLFNQRREDGLLGQLASSNFQTDWGTRSIPLNSKAFVANSYAKGSVWAVGTASVALDFWMDNRPAEAFSIWSGLVPWISLDSLGHLNEVLAGDYYHQQTESVPEQTWSSAAFLDAAVRGLLGLEVQAISNRVVLAPHLPANWKTIAVRNIRLPQSNLSMSITRTPNDLQLKSENRGAPVKLLFQPALPLGARITGADLNGKPVKTSLEEHSQDSDARVEIEMPSGTETLNVRYQGGVSLVLPPSHPLAGNPSRNIKVIKQQLSNNRYVLDAEVDPTHASTFELVTPWKIVDVKGASQRLIAADTYEFTIPPSKVLSETPEYVPVKINVSVAR